MEIELINKVDELIAIFENSIEIKRIKQLKEEIYNDPELKKLLDKYKEIKDTNTKEEKIDIKSQIINNEKISEYRKLEHELYLLILAINKKLNSLKAVDKKCA